VRGIVEKKKPKFKCSKCGKKCTNLRGLKTHERWCKGEIKSKSQRNAVADERRIKVAHFRMQGAPPLSIAEGMKVPIRTIYEDIAYIRQQMLNELKTESRGFIAAEEVKKADYMEGEFRRDYFATNRSNAPGAKKEFGRMWADMWHKKINVLQSFGILPKTPDQLQILLSDKDYATMSLHELATEKTRLIEMLEKSEAETANG